MQRAAERDAERGPLAGLSLAPPRGRLRSFARGALRMTRKGALRMTRKELSSLLAQPVGFAQGRLRALRMMTTKELSSPLLRRFGFAEGGLYGGRREGGGGGTLTLALSRKGTGEGKEGERVEGGSEACLTVRGGAGRSGRHVEVEHGQRGKRE
jgi:hypothetical protein